MKNLILGIAVLGLAIACKNTDNASISDPGVAEAPAAAVCPVANGAQADGQACNMADGQTCDMADGQTCDMAAGETSDKAAGEGCDMAAGEGCEGDAPACCIKGQEGAQVCPVTGQEVEN